ncbi:MAG: hypothetical protein WD734_04245 [Dehalococcoidia bacterium]
MARLYVEDWSPEYGAPFESDADPLPSEVVVDTAVEVPGTWEPLPGRDDGVRHVAFVDGVQRLEARLTLDDPDTGPVPGICAAYAVGACVWDREARRSAVRDVSVGRLAILGGGRSVVLPPTPGLDYVAESIDAVDMPSLRARLDTRRGQVETDLVRALALTDCFVVADGRIHDLGAHEMVGYVKSHHHVYLGPPQSRVIGALRPGERSPVFLIPEGQFQRYSWYVRLADNPHGHSWSGIARVETPGAIGIERARVLADRTAALLPQAAMPLHLDARAPQNLVPIAGLEKELRRWLGDQALVRRGLRAALQGATADATAAMPEEIMR